MSRRALAAHENNPASTGRYLMRPLAALAGLAPLLLATTTLAATPPVFVGQCKAPTLGYSTIAAAVTAAPAGGTVVICPGTYPEQITITKNLTLNGITSGNSSAVMIVAPPGGIVANSTSLDGGNPIAAQIAVQNATTVNINNIGVDGSNNGITGCAPNLVGILYQNASGAVRNSAITNEALTANLNGCQSGQGIFVESGGTGSSSIMIVNNTVSGFQKNGIAGHDANTILTVQLNTVTGQGPTTGAAENGIELAYGATGRVINNYVADMIYSPVAGNTGNGASGILLYAAPGSTVSNNVVANTQFGIAVAGDNNGDADSATLNANHVQATHAFDGIDICGAGNATVTNNFVNGSDEAGIHLDSSCGAPSLGNTVKSNHINGACAGILQGTGSTASFATNTIVNAANVTLTGSDVCPAATTSAFPRSRHASHRPAP
jgi:parallel beta-helix repeat protein